MKTVSYYQANCEKIKAYARERYRRNRKKLIAQRRAYMAANPDKIREYRSAYYQRNKKKEIARALAWNAAHPEQIKEWCEKNRSGLQKGRRARYHQRMAEPGFRLAKNLRSRVRKALKTNAKSAATLKLIGCTIPQWRAHLESQFRPGMTWENYGPGWEVDHIKPCSKFDLSDPAQQRACFHYSNTQPLFKEENLRKNAKFSQPKETPKSHEQQQSAHQVSFSEIATLDGDAPDCFRRAENY